MSGMQPQQSGWGAPPNIPQGQPPFQPVAASQKKHHAWGLIIPLVVFILLFLGAMGFGVWAYGGMQDYKNNVSDKVKSAVQIAIQQEDSKKDKEFIDKEK